MRILPTIFELGLLLFSVFVAGCAPNAEVSPSEGAVAVWREFVVAARSGDTKSQSRLANPEVLCFIAGGDLSSTTQDRLKTLGEAWQNWDVKVRLASELSVVLAVGPQLKAHVVTLQKTDNSWVIVSWNPGQ